MNKLRITLLILSLLVIFTVAFATIASAATSPAISWYVTAGGGGHVETAGGTFALDSTIGQPIAGETNSDLCSGFWCSVAEWITELHIYLPLIVRE